MQPPPCFTIKMKALPISSNRKNHLIISSVAQRDEPSRPLKFYSCFNAPNHIFVYHKSFNYEYEVFCQN